MKKALLSFKNALLFSLPSQYNVENQKKLQVVSSFQLCMGVGARLGRWSNISLWRVRKSAKIANLFDDFFLSMFIGTRSLDDPTILKFEVT